MIVKHTHEVGGNKITVAGILGRRLVIERGRLHRLGNVYARGSDTHRDGARRHENVVEDVVVVADGGNHADHKFTRGAAAEAAVT